MGIVYVLPLLWDQNHIFAIQIIGRLNNVYDVLVMSDSFVT